MFKFVEGGLHANITFIFSRPTAGENSKKPTHLRVYVRCGHRLPSDVQWWWIEIKCKIFIIFRLIVCRFQAENPRNRPRLSSRHLTLTRRRINGHVTSRRRMDGDTTLILVLCAFNVHVAQVRVYRIKVIPLNACADQEGVGGRGSGPPPHEKSQKGVRALRGYFGPL